LCTYGQYQHFIMLVEDLTPDEITCRKAMSMSRIMAFLTFYEGLGKDPNSIYNRAKHFLQLVKYTNILPEGEKLPLRSLQQYYYLHFLFLGCCVITPK
jgi:hypothetical protein